MVPDEMVNRFLSWRLPEDFSPDAGISFKADYNEGTPYPGRHQPTGTNLLNADQARAMLEHVLAAAPDRFGLIELLWGQGKATLDCTDSGEFRIDFEGAEGGDRIWIGMDPKDATDLALKAVKDGEVTAA